jgi:hypothetical protein
MGRQQATRDFIAYDARDDSRSGAVATAMVNAATKWTAR